MKNRILLNGAGFSANFNAPVAADMSNLVFNDNQVQNNQKLRMLLQDNFDYEDVYHCVMHSDKYDEVEKNILDTAIKQAYITVDNRIIGNNSLTQTYSDLFKEFIFRFSIPYNGSGFIFTLNQDLLIERRFNHYPDSSLSGITLPIMGSSVFNKQWSDPLSNENKRIVPDEEEFTREKQEYERKISSDKIQLSYIKLHGSQDWFKNDDHQMMVIGNGKYDQITTEPLLSWYFELFQKQLARSNTKLFIIGYGFNDEHINKAIAEANKLDIYIIDILSRQDFAQRLNEKNYGQTIANSIRGYYRLSLLDLFPNDFHKNPHTDWDSIKNNFFTN